MFEMKELEILRKTQVEIVALYFQLKNDPAGRFNNLAGPQLSAEPEHYFTQPGKRVLLIGKATRGEFYRTEFELADEVNSPNRFEKLVSERLSRTKAFLQEVTSGNYSSAFWKLASKLNEQATNGKENKNGGLSNLVWSNLIKIGVENGNPSPKYIRPQVDASIEMLRAELNYYKPDLIFASTGTFATEISDGFLGNHGWEKPSDDLWYRNANKGFPAIVVTDHPERKHNEMIGTWLTTASHLLNK
jgi:hypothetical protein